jgi:hypothetical protein
MAVEDVGACSTGPEDLSASVSPSPQRLVLGLFSAWCWLAKRRLNVLFYLVLFLIGTLAVLAAPHRIHRWAHDTFIFLDGGWRVLNGQRPYVDFFTGLGPVTFQLVALGLKISGGTAAGIDYGFAAASMLLGVWAWLLVKPRMERPAGCLVAMFVALLVISPHALGSRPDILTYASIYNRLAYALIAIVLVEAVCPLRAPNAGSLFAGGLSSGAACALLFFVKPSFFLIAVLIAGGGFLFFDHRSPRRTLGILAGMATISLAMLAYLRFDVGAIWFSVRTVGTARLQAQSGDPRMDVGVYPFFKHAFDKIGHLAGLMFLALLVSSLPRRARVHRYLDPWWPLAAAGAVCIVESLFLMTNGTQNSVPLLAVFALLLASQIHTWWQSAPAGDRHRHGPICGFGLIFALVLFLPDMVSDFASLVYSSGKSVAGRPLPARFKSLPLRALMTRETPADWEEPNSGKQYVDLINEGTDLLERSSAPAESVFALDYVNPFSYALQRIPAPGGGPYLGGSIFNSGHMAPTEWMLGRADLVMVPKQPALPRLARMLDEIFGQFLRDRFSLAAESPSWLMYRRKTTSLLPDHGHGTVIR